MLAAMINGFTIVKGEVNFKKRQHYLQGSNFIDYKLYEEKEEKEKP